MQKILLVVFSLLFIFSTSVVALSDTKDVATIKVNVDVSTGLYTSIETQPEEVSNLPHDGKAPETHALKNKAVSNLPTPLTSSPWVRNQVLFAFVAIQEALSQRQCEVVHTGLNDLKPSKPSPICGLSSRRPRSSAEWSRLLATAKRHSPVFYLSSSEKYFPSDPHIHALKSDLFVGEDKVFPHMAHGVPSPSPPQPLSFTLRDAKDRAGDTPDHKNQVHTPVFADILVRGGGTIASVQYHIFFPFNAHLDVAVQTTAATTNVHTHTSKSLSVDLASLLPLDPIGQHEGDWETVELHVDLLTDSLIGISLWDHKPENRSLLAVDDSGLGASSVHFISRDDLTLKEEGGGIDRVELFIAKHSHTLYTRPGLHRLHMSTLRCNHEGRELNALLHTPDTNTNARPRTDKSSLLETGASTDDVDGPADEDESGGDTVSSVFLSSSLSDHTNHGAKWDSRSNLVFVHSPTYIGSPYQQRLYNDALAHNQSSPVITDVDQVYSTWFTEVFLNIPKIQNDPTYVPLSVPLPYGPWWLAYTGVWGKRPTASPYAPSLLCSNHARRKLTSVLQSRIAHTLPFIASTTRASVSSLVMAWLCRDAKPLLSGNSDPGLVTMSPVSSASQTKREELRVKTRCPGIGARAFVPSNNQPQSLLSLDNQSNLSLQTLTSLKLSSQRNIHDLQNRLKNTQKLEMESNQAVAAAKLSEQQINIKVEQHDKELAETKAKLAEKITLETSKKNELIDLRNKAKQATTDAKTDLDRANLAALRQSVDKVDKEHKDVSKEVDNLQLRITSLTSELIQIRKDLKIEAKKVKDALSLSAVKTRDRQRAERLVESSEDMIERINARMRGASRVEKEVKRISQIIENDLAVEHAQVAVTRKKNEDKWRAEQLAILENITLKATAEEKTNLNKRLTVLTERETQNRDKLKQAEIELTQAQANAIADEKTYTDAQFNVDKPSLDGVQAKHLASQVQLGSSKSAVDRLSRQVKKAESKVKEVKDRLADLNGVDRDRRLNELLVHREPVWRDQYQREDLGAKDLVAQKLKQARIEAEAAQEVLIKKDLEMLDKLQVAKMNEFLSTLTVEDMKGSLRRAEDKMKLNQKELQKHTEELNNLKSTLSHGQTSLENVKKQQIESKKKVDDIQIKVSEVDKQLQETLSIARQGKSPQIGSFYKDYSQNQAAATPPSTPAAPATPSTPAPVADAKAIAQAKSRVIILRTQAVDTAQQLTVALAKVRELEEEEQRLMKWMQGTQQQLDRTQNEVTALEKSTQDSQTKMTSVSKTAMEASMNQNKMKQVVNVVKQAQSSRVT